MSRAVKSAQDETTRLRTYFRKDHQGRDLGYQPLSHVKHYRPDAKTKYVYVHYKFSGSPEKYKSPRSLTKWLDSLDKFEIEKELDTWMQRVNENIVGNYTSVFIPEFFKSQKTDYIKYCNIRAKKQTIVNYLTRLERFIFPFFVQKMKLNDPKDWPSEYQRWELYLDEVVKNAVTRNHIRTALRIYLKFLEKKLGYPRFEKPSNESFKKDHREGKILPQGKLPSDEELMEWFNTLPSGRARWVIGLCIAFGVRVSEAIPANESDLLGAADVKDIEKSKDLIGSIHAKFGGAAYLQVSTAIKKKVARKDLNRILGKDPDTEPKSGPYTAACFNPLWANRLFTMIASGEESAEFKRENPYEEVLDTVKYSGHPLFSQYGLHDFRRLSITRQVIKNHDFFVTARLHGQASVDTVRRYYQWGLETNRIEKKRKFKPIEAVLTDPPTK